MTSPRLTASIRVAALIRLAESQGGFGAVAAKGDASAGQLLIVALEKGQFSRLFEPVLDMTGVYRWQPCGPDASGEQAEIDAYLARRRLRDPDLWIVELDVPGVTRFIGEQASAT